MRFDEKRRRWMNVPPPKKLWCDASVPAAGMRCDKHLGVHLSGPQIDAQYEHLVSIKVDGVELEGELRDSVVAAVRGRKKIDWDDVASKATCRAAITSDK